MSGHLIILLKLDVAYFHEKWISFMKSECIFMKSEYIFKKSE